MGLVERTLDSGLILTEGGMDFAAVERELRKRDGDLSLQGWPSQTHGCTLWKVVRYAGPDRPPDTVCVWQSDRGEPYPLSSGILDLVDRLDRNSRFRHVGEDEINAARDRELERQVERDREAILDDHTFKHGRPVLPRSQSTADGPRQAARERGEGMSSLSLTPTTPTPLTLTPGGGNVATDPIWDAKGDLAVGTAADTATKLTVGSNGQVLTADSAQTTGIKWAPAPTGGGMIADTLWDTKGDLAVASAADTGAKLPVGADTFVLTADSAQTLGVKWAAPAGASGALTQLYNLVLGSAGTFDQASISGSYNDLILVLIARGAASFATTTAYIRFNNDSGTNYSSQGETATASAVSAVEDPGVAQMDIAVVPAASATANWFGTAEIWIPGYASTTWTKSARAVTGSSVGLSTSQTSVRQFLGVWNSTAAVTRIQLFPGTSGANFATGSVLRIYGRT